MLKRQFKDRKEAGQLLAKELSAYAHKAEWLVIALPRGGVIVGFEIARALKLPLDIICPRKIGAPSNPEYAIGALTESGEAIFSEGIDLESISKDFLNECLAREKKEAERRLAYYRKGMPVRNLMNQRIILVDDGLATGSTMRAAIAGLKKAGAKEIVVAVPVSPIDTAERIASEVDDFYCLMTPALFYAVGAFYEEFPQITDEEVIALLHEKIL